MTPKQNKFKSLQSRLIAHRRTAYRDFALFRRFYFKHYHKAPDAAFHGELAGLLNTTSLKRNIKLAIAAPRNSAKSTIITLEYVIYSICHKREDFIVIISNTAEQAAGFLTNVKDELESNNRLKLDFPEVCELMVKPKPVKWAQKTITTKNGIKVMVLSVDQNIRGWKHHEHRPTLIILDDVETNESVKSDDSRYKLQDWFEKAVLKSGSSRTNVIFTGTIHHYGSLLAQYTNPKTAPGWISQIYRSITSESGAINEWQTWKDIYHFRREFNSATGPEAALAYFMERKGTMLAGTAVLWPQSKGYYDLMVMREQDGVVSFDSEMQNEPVNPRDCFFNVDDFHFWDKKYTSAEELISTLKNPVFFAACDPSLGKEKSRGDYSAILTGVKDYDTDTLYLIDVDLERRQPDNLIETILDYLKLRDVSHLAIESNNFQEVLVDNLRKKCTERKISTYIDPVQHTKDKTSRVQALQLFLKSGKIQLSRSHTALIDQLKYFPKHRHDDGPDALEMLYIAAQSSGHFDPSMIKTGGRLKICDLFPELDNCDRPYGKSNFLSGLLSC